MRMKITLIGTLFMLMLFTAPSGYAQTQTAEVEFTSGLSVGDTLEYTVEIDDDFDSFEELTDSDLDFEDGDTISAVVTESIDGTEVGEYSNFFGESVTYDAPGEFTTTLPNGTEIIESSDVYVLPTTIELENGTDYTGGDAMALAGGAGVFGTVSESDGIVTISLAFIIIFRQKYDAETGIMQEYTVVDADGEGEFRIVLGGGGLLGSLPAYDTPVFLALTFSAVAFVNLRRKKNN